MKFGVREICNVTFKAKSKRKIGNSEFQKGQPVLMIDTAKTSNMEGAATTVYANGGRGNTRLIAWEGEKTLTFTVEDALLSPAGFSILSGAGLLKQPEHTMVRVHSSGYANIEFSETEAPNDTLTLDLTDSLGAKEQIDKTAPVFAMVAEEDGSLTGELISGLTVDSTGKKLENKAATELYEKLKNKAVAFVDFYIQKDGSTVSELQIDAANFAGYYYVEAETLFRPQGKDYDLPAIITMPNVKIQSNFTFAMASTGDPSTFTFTMDAFPGYTMFDNTKKVLCVMQIVEDVENNAKDPHSVMLAADKVVDGADSVTDNDEVIL